MSILPNTLFRDYFKRLLSKKLLENGVKKAVKGNINGSI